ncbi:MAG: ABC transporter permease, partial [Bauldia sp.]|nr:ABC transporter permease [Bauldia sp.]
MDSDIAFSAVRISTPLIFAAMGGLLTYQAGMLNIALDGFMIVAAFAAIAVAYVTGSLGIALLAGVFFSVVMAALLALFNLRFRAHIFIAGIAVTFLAYGLTALLLKGLLGEDGVFSANTIPTFSTIEIPLIKDIPWIGRVLSGHTILVYLAYLSVPVVAWFLYRTRWGLRVRVVGEAEDAALAAGVNVERIKLQT